MPMKISNKIYLGTSMEKERQGGREKDEERQTEMMRDTIETFKQCMTLPLTVLSRTLDGNKNQLCHLLPWSDSQMQIGRAHV